MISKIVKLLFLSALVCSAVLPITMTSITLHENKTTIGALAGDSAECVPPNLMLIGDPVPGGGTPSGTNQTGNHTA